MVSLPRWELGISGAACIFVWLLLAYLAPPIDGPRLIAFYTAAWFGLLGITLAVGEVCITPLLGAETDAGQATVVAKETTVVVVGTPADEDENEEAGEEVHAVEPEGAAAGLTKRPRRLAWTSWAAVTCLGCASVLSFCGFVEVAVQADHVGDVEYTADRGFAAFVALVVCAFCAGLAFLGASYGDEPPLPLTEDGHPARSSGCNAACSVLTIVGLVLYLFVLFLAVWHGGGSANHLNDVIAPGVFLSLPWGRVHWYCTGEADSPSPGTVVFLHGYGGSSLDISWVQRSKVLRSAHPSLRFCSFDRPGYGWSDSADRPRSSGVVAKDIADILIEGGISGKTVIVAHSLGWYHTLALVREVREVRASVPFTIDGAVSVDGLDPFWIPGGPQTLARLPSECDASADSVCDNSCGWFWAPLRGLVASGFARFGYEMNVYDYRTLLGALPEDVYEAYVGNSNAIKYFQTRVDEGSVWSRACGESNKTSTLGAAFPLEVIACGGNYGEGGFPGSTGLNSTDIMRYSQASNLTYLPSVTHEGILFQEANAEGHVVPALMRVISRL